MADDGGAAVAVRREGGVGREGDEDCGDGLGSGRVDEFVLVERLEGGEGAAVGV